MITHYNLGGVDPLAKSFAGCFPGRHPRGRAHVVDARLFIWIETESHCFYLG